MGNLLIYFPINYFYIFTSNFSGPKSVSIYDYNPNFYFKKRYINGTAYPAIAFSATIYPKPNFFLKYIKYSISRSLDGE